MPTFIIYSKIGCPYCVRIKQIMDLKEFKYVLYILNQDFTKEEFYAKFGEGSTFPQVVMNEQILGGCTDTVKYLKENNMI
jgi:glutaredoxin 3